MKVKALHQIAYNGTGYKAGDVFGMDDKDLERYQGDVVETKAPKAKAKNHKKTIKNK